MNTKGRSLELFFVNGKPDQMLTAEVFGWTGHVLMFPRTQLVEAFQRKETKFTGIYLLIGENEQGPLAYVGEAEDVGSRIKNHDVNKDWWTSVVLITSAANNLNKAHVKYLESRMVEIAKSVGRMDLENGNTPSRPSLSESVTASMEVFLEHILLVLPALQIDFLLSNARPTVSSEKMVPDRKVPIFEIIHAKFGIDAKAVLDNGEFVVQKDSIARGKWVGQASITSSYSKLCEQLIRQKILVQEGEARRFTENYAFNSPSAAAAVIQGRSSNGPTNWKVRGSKKTYKEWEIEEMNKLN
ncbi:MAG: methionine sulfoxide reductase [Robiginitomaculum sp.]|nr:MAG: methionine sulfoxide reductase [Robiginitomaculum sp.]